MSFAVTENDMARVLDAVYDAAIATDGWPVALQRLGGLFNSHFADLFARTNDWSAFGGIAVGLDRADYEDQFLGQWTNRNVWAQASPAQIHGEIKPTWQMVSKQEVLRSAIYNEYLRHRDLNEGLRLVLWSGEGWLQDVSLLRPWSAGPFDLEEVALARTLLPHLQRASMTSRRLQGVDALDAFDGLELAAFLLTARGKLVRYNARAEPLLEEPGGLRLRAGYLEATSVEDTAGLGAAVARAGCIGLGLPRSSTVPIARNTDARPLSLTVLPVRDRGDYTLPGPRAVLVVAGRPTLVRGWTEREMQARFGLTQAEAALACELLTGRSLGDIADAKARSVNTVRAQLARILLKTNTRRQSELVLLLSRGA